MRHRTGGAGSVVGGGAATRRDFLRVGATGMAAGLSLGAVGAVGPSAAQGKPLPAAEFGRKRGAAGRHGMVITSHPLATRAAVEMLQRGGNACDAALTAAITQTVVEPHMTTITGMLSLLYYDAAARRSTYCNGSINAPLAPLPSVDRWSGRPGLRVAVAGWWAAFEAALARHGSRPKGEVMAAAIRYARGGFPIHPFLYGVMYGQMEDLGAPEQGREVYFPQRALLSPGQVLKQERLADTYERLVEQGSEYYYRGEFAKEFVNQVRAGGGVITREDLERYEVRWDEPARGTYRGYEIVASPPPDNGGTHVIEALNMIELLDLQRLGPPTESPEVLYQMARIADEVMQSGRRQTDPRSHRVPLEVLLSKDYARIRFELMQMAAPVPSPDSPPPGSTHVTVVDGRGNVATLLHSNLALAWATRLWAHGIYLTGAGGHFSRVMPKPGFRGSVYVAPNIVFKDGRPILASGSPSISLVANILQNTVNLLDFGLDIETSVHRPRFGAVRDGRCLIEPDIDPKVRAAAARGGWSWAVVNPWNEYNGSFEGVRIDPAGGLTACADPRRAGHAEGY
jgi:gamma-glutamyltranspeptidase/glutathione hydrolase